MPFHSGALRASLAAAAAFVAFMASPLAPRAEAGPQAACSGRLCFNNNPGTKSCFKRDGKPRVSKCFIKRAAAHFGESRDQAYAIAYRESRFDYKVTNSSSGAAGLYQFMPATWDSTPYGRRSPYNPKWASLAAMWMWAHGGYHHWSL